jgi:hypothetical protein
MEKSMYSLMLMDSVVKEIDRLAYEQSTNRSNLINRILAEYLRIKTPETRIKEIFDLMTEHLNSLTGFKVQSLTSDFRIAIKSPLEYKYRPTIKYSVEIYRSYGDAVGELRVVFRTRHSELLSRLAAFFELWIGMETFYIHKLFKDASILYRAEEGRFTRTFMLPASEETVTNDLLSKAIGDYIEMFDGILKQYLYSPQADQQAIERLYVDYLKNGMIII